MKRGELVDRTNPRVEHVEADCRDCDWRVEGAHHGLNNTQKQARHHVLMTGHHVRFRKSCVSVYRPLPIEAHA